VALEKNQKIGLGAAILVGINAMIGAGILTIPTMLSAIVGPAGIISCIFSILVVLAMGLSLGRASQIYPGQGWSYLYSSKWAGHKIGMISSYLYVVGILLAMGLLIQQAGVYGTYALSFVSPNFSPKLLSAIILCLLTVLIIAGAQASSWVQYIITCLKVPLVLIAVFCWFFFDPKLVVPFMPYGWSSIFTATPIILFAFFGFESVVSLYPVIENPNKNVSKAAAASILITGLIYIIFFYGILFAIPKEYFAGGLAEPISNVLNKFFVNYQFLSLFVLIGGWFAIVGTLHSVIWSVSELLTSVLKLSKSSGVQIFIKKGFWSSALSVISCSAFVLLSFLFLDVESFISVTALFIVPSYVLSVASVLFIRQDWKSGRNLIALFGLLGGFVFFYFAVQKTLALFF
jgi:amino acid transporter